MGEGILYGSWCGWSSLNFGIRSDKKVWEEQVFGSGMTKW